MKNLTVKENALRKGGSQSRETSAIRKYFEELLENLGGEESTRVGTAVTGIIILVLGLLVVGGSVACTSLEGEWLGGLISLAGFLTGVCGAAAKNNMMTKAFQP